MDVGDGGQVEFGPTPGRRRPGRTECNFPFPWVFFVSFIRPAELGGRRSGSPARIDHFDLGRDMVKGGEMVVLSARATASRRHDPSGRM